VDQYVVNHLQNQRPTDKDQEHSKDARLNTLNNKLYVVQILMESICENCEDWDGMIDEYPGRLVQLFYNNLNNASKKDSLMYSTLRNYLQHVREFLKWWGV
jgi:hypothetical protein